MVERRPTSHDIRQRYPQIEVSPENSTVNEIANSLGTVVFGQEEACLVMAKAIARFEAGVGVDGRRPLESALFTGETGTGKTEMAHAIALHMFGDKNSERLKILNMGEYSERHDVKKITGSPPSYVGGEEESAIPHDWLHKGRSETNPQFPSIIVFDEIEKADRSVQRAMLSIMDKGTLDARNGKHGFEPLDFSRSVILMTSNIGAADMKKGRLGFASNNEREDSSDIGDHAVKKEFALMPEFLGRVDDRVVFKRLGREQYEQIFDKFIDELNRGMKETRSSYPDVVPSQEYVDFLLSKVDYSFGARDIKKAIQRELTPFITDYVLSGTMDGEVIYIAYDEENDEVSFHTDSVEEWCDDEPPIRKSKKQKKKEQSPKLSPETNPLREGLPQLPQNATIVDFPFDRKNLQQ